MNVRRTLPWVLSVPLMSAGSFTAHALGATLAAPRVAGSIDSDHAIETAKRVDHGYLTSLPLAAGLAAGLILSVAGLRMYHRIRGNGSRGASPHAFLLLPALAYVLQEIAERLLHAEAFPFNPVHEPSFALALLLQVPFGVVAFFVGRALLGLGRRLLRALARRRRAWSITRPVADPIPPETVLARISVLAVGRSGRGPPVALVL